MEGINFEQLKSLKTKTIGFRTTPLVYEKITRIAKKNGSNRAAVVELIVEKYLQWCVTGVEKKCLTK